MESFLVFDNFHHHVHQNYHHYHHSNNHFHYRDQFDIDSVMSFLAAGKRTTLPMPMGPWALARWSFLRPPWGRLHDLVHLPVLHIFTYFCTPTLKNLCLYQINMYFVKFYPQVPIYIYFTQSSLYLMNSYPLNLQILNWLTSCKQLHLSSTQMTLHWITH